VLAWTLLPVPAQAQFTQQGPKLVGNGAIGDALQGGDVALSADGNTAIVGGISDDNGSRRRMGVQALGRGMEPASETGAIGSFVLQGNSVSLSSDGNTAIVGGPGGKRAAGAAWVYTRSGGVWSQQARLVGTGAVGAAGQGNSVSLAGDGNTAIVGGPGDNSEAGAAWVYTRSGGVWSQQAKLVG
jgi:hypothetical protein